MSKIQSLSSPFLFESVVIPYLWRESDSIFYRIDSAEAADVSYGCVSPRVAREMSAGRGGDRCLTYGEVLPESIARDVFDACLEPALRRAVELASEAGAKKSAASVAGGAGAGAGAGADTEGATTAAARVVTVYDLGSGTGKIPLHLSLLARASGLNDVLSVGVELVRERHVAADKALERARRVTGTDLTALLLAAAADAPPGFGALPSPDEAAAELRSAALATRADHGNILEHTWPSNADAIFINNTVFEPVLMTPLLERLAIAAKTKLRRVVVLRALCPRHREGGGCDRRGIPCTAFSYPPVVETTCEPTWDAVTSLFAYDTVRAAQDIITAAGGSAAAAGAAVGAGAGVTTKWSPSSPPTTPKRPREVYPATPTRRAPPPVTQSTIARASPRVIQPSPGFSNPATPVRPVARGLESPPRIIRRRRTAAAAAAAAPEDADDASSAAGAGGAGAGASEIGLPLPPDVRGASRATLGVDLNAAIFSHLDEASPLPLLPPPSVSKPAATLVIIDPSLRTPVRTGVRKALVSGGTPSTSLLLSPVGLGVWGTPQPRSQRLIER